MVGNLKLSTARKITNFINLFSVFCYYALFNFIIVELILYCENLNNFLHVGNFNFSKFLNNSESNPETFPIEINPESNLIYFL